jgi:PPE-repeat protein
VTFAFLPPELISSWLYTGPGSGPLLAAASAWESLAADLGSSATSFQSVVSGLTGAWQGPSSTQMTTAAQPYMAWISDTATQAQQASVNAGAAAAAYETAFGATVPPPEIALNRSTLMALVATNFLGQNSPAIAMTEALYSEMWAQDVAMIQSYAGAAQQAMSSLQLFNAAPTVANATTMATNAASPASSSGNILASLPQAFSAALSNLTTGIDPTGALSGLTSVGLPTSITSGITGAESTLSGLTSGLTSQDLIPIQATYYLAMMGSMPARMFMSMGQSAASGGGMNLANMSESLLNNVGQLVDGKMQAIVGGVSGQLRSWGSAVSAQLAHAANIGGRMSVPQGWSAAATTMSRAAPVLPATSVPSPTLAGPSMGMPGGSWGQALAGALSGRGLTSVAGKAPKVVPRSPAAG